MAKQRGCTHAQMTIPYAQQQIIQFSQLHGIKIY